MRGGCTALALHFLMYRFSGILLGHGCLGAFVITANQPQFY
jgi:hypothetical protein